MARVMMCENGDGTTAYLVQTVQETGDVTALCAPCLLEWAAALLEASGNMDQYVAAYIERMVAGMQDYPPNDTQPARKGTNRTATRVKDTGATGESTPADTTAPPQ